MLISLAIDHRRSDLATRELLARSAQHSGLPTRSALAPPLEELLLLSTCNRFELYGWTDGDPEQAFAALEAHWPEAPGARALLAAAIRRRGPEVEVHLLRVAAGLESQVAGDSHVLAQVRRAYTEAVERGTIGPALHRVVQAALATGRRVRRETEFIRAEASAATEGAALIARRAATRETSRIVILGAGKMARAAAAKLRRIAGAELVIVNRSEEGAHALAAEIFARTAPLETVYAELAQADFALLASTAPEALVRASALDEARTAAGQSAPLLLVDLGVPRNAEPLVSGIAGVKLVDMEGIGVTERLPDPASRGAAEEMVEAALADLRRRRAIGILEHRGSNSTRGEDD